jgi:hypothetical protein
MPITGRKPKPPDQRRNRVPPRHDWVEVPNVPFEGAPPLPPFPKVFRPFGFERNPPRNWPTPTRCWWDAISRMPHCVLWDQAEWQFAMDTALVVLAFHCGELRYGKEMRDREKILGNTADARRDLRIRYVDPSTGSESDPADTASVTAMADYQRMVDDPS